MGYSKSSSKREVYCNKILLQEIRKTLNRQPNFIPKATGKNNQKKKKIAEGKNNKDPSRNKCKRKERNNSKD